MTRLYPAALDQMTSRSTTSMRFPLSRRMLIVWPFDESGTLIGEDSYTGQAGLSASRSQGAQRRAAPESVNEARHSW